MTTNQETVKDATQNLNKGGSATMAAIEEIMRRNATPVSSVDYVTAEARLREIMKPARLNPA